MEKKKESINAIARNLLSKYKGNFEKATSSLKKIFLTDSQLVEKYKDEIFGRAASAIVQSIFAINRSSLFKTVPTLEKGVSGESQQANIMEKVKASVKNETEALLNMALNVCKKQLRYATKEDLVEEINMFVTHARGTDSRATFLTLIYEGLSDEKVGDVYTERDLVQIMERTQKLINRKWNGKFVKVEERKEELVEA